jgi:hypothetical protein
MDPKTVRKYVKAAIDAGIVPGGPPLGAEEWAQLAEGWFPELVDWTSTSALAWKHRSMI